MDNYIFIIFNMYISTDYNRNYLRLCYSNSLYAVLTLSAPFAPDEKYPDKQDSLLDLEVG